MLGAQNSSQSDDFFTRGRHENFDVHYLNQSYFGLPRQNIRNESIKKLVFKQTLRDVESRYKVIGGYDMKYYETKKMCRKSWSGKFNYLCIDLTKKKNPNIVFPLKAKTHILNPFVKLNLFSFLNVNS